MSKVGSRQLTVMLLAVILLGPSAFAPATLKANAQSSRADLGLKHLDLTKCGGERWSVKTGTDGDARLVNRTNTVHTTIHRLRSLAAPRILPAAHRVRPVEITVYRLKPTIVRYRLESNADIQLILSDAAGRTMTAALPAPRCVGASSRFLAAIRRVRGNFQRHYHPAAFWQRTRIPVTITGVGFFDVRHKQLGAAPNAIQLHPVLSIRYRSIVAPTVHPSPTPVRPKKVPTPATGAFVLTVRVSPRPVISGQLATLSAHAAPGAVCTASVIYSTGKSPASFNGSARSTDAAGNVSWSWHVDLKTGTGTGTVVCTYLGHRQTSSTSFTIG